MDEHTRHADDAATVVLREGDMQRALTRIAHEIAERNAGAGAPSLVGIHRRGAFLARRLQDTLQQLLGTEVALGDLDIGFSRDDWRIHVRQNLWGVLAIAMEQNNDVKSLLYEIGIAEFLIPTVPLVAVVLYHP